MEGPDEGDGEMQTPLQTAVVFEDGWEENPLEFLGVLEEEDGRNVF